MQNDDVIARWHGLVVDAPDPQQLAAFYEQLLGMMRVQDSADWVVIGDAPDRPGIAFQRVDGYRPPEWPTTEHSQQMHLDLRVDDLDEGEAQVLALGAQKLEGNTGGNFRVFADPVGHPFCLVTF